MKIPRKHLIHDIASFLEELEHGTALFKFVTKDDASPGDQSNGEFLPKVELHGLISDDGDVFILSEKISSTEDTE